jgi:hypothetical protein
MLESFLESENDLLKKAIEPVRDDIIHDLTKMKKYNIFNDNLKVKLL